MYIVLFIGALIIADALPAEPIQYRELRLCVQDGAVWQILHQLHAGISRLYRHLFLYDDPGCLRLLAFAFPGQRADLLALVVPDDGSL